MPKLKRYLLLLLLYFVSSCQSNYTPKPSGFFRVKLPTKKYSPVLLDCPFTFEHTQYANIRKRPENCWFDLEFNLYQGILHMSYKNINENLNTHIETARELAYKHSSVAEAISEQPYINTMKKVFGIMYTFEGKTATAIQFYITDSSQHFVRGALYFNTEMNDSITPISNFIKEDIYHLVETWQWK